MSEINSFNEFNQYSVNQLGHDNCKHIVSVLTPLGEYLAEMQIVNNKPQFSREVLFPNSKELLEQIKDSFQIKNVLKLIKSRIVEINDSNEIKPQIVADLDDIFSQQFTQYTDSHNGLLKVVILDVPIAKSEEAFKMGACYLNGQWLAMQHMFSYYQLWSFIPKTYFNFDKDQMPKWDEVKGQYYLENDDPSLAAFKKLENDLGLLGSQDSSQAHNSDDDFTKKDEQSKNKEPTGQEVFNKTLDNIQEGLGDILKQGEVVHTALKNGRVVFDAFFKKK